MAASANYWKVETEQPSPGCFSFLECQFTIQESYMTKQASGGHSHIIVHKWGNKYCNNREVATGWALQQTRFSKYSYKSARM
jgi:hypothetical protein